MTGWRTNLLAAFGLLLTAGAVSAADSALSFDGSNDFVTFGAAPGLGVSNFTIEVWFKRTGTGENASSGSGGLTAIPLVTKGRGEGDNSNVDMNYFLGIRSSDNVLAADFEGFDLGTNHPVAGVTPIARGAWYHAAATYDGSQWRLYLNGLLETNITVNQLPRWDSIQHAGLATAMNSTGVTNGLFNGLLDEVRIWNYARSAQEIAGNRYVQIVAAPGLIGRWGLNEGSGTIASDSSGSGISGTLSNGPVWAVDVLQNGIPPVIAEGESWRYFKGTNFPSGYTTNGFNDSSWSTGPSGFGYGDGDDATVLNDMTNSVGGYVSVFIRKKFVISDPAAVSNLVLAVDYDDGFAAYINGAEVARRNIPAGNPSNTTLASGNHEASRGTGSGNPQEKEFITISTNSLMAGTNVLALSGHNVSTTSSDLTLIPELYIGVTLVRGPFIQMPNTNAVTVVWRTSALTDSAVDYGFDTNYTGGTVTDGALVREHAVDLPGLLPNTNYYYRVRSGGVTLAQGDYFKTRRAGSQPFKFAVIGDFGQGSAGMSNIANQVNAGDFDLFLTVGDNIYEDGQPGYYDPYWFSLYAPTMRRAATFPTLGNHDVDQGSYSGIAFLNNFYLPTNGPAGQIERNYSYDFGNAHFTAADSNPFTNVAINAATCAAIKTWLSNDLAATSQPWKFVYFHHPPRTSIGGHDDELGVQTNLMPIVEAAGVDMVFVGHNHFYERINAINGVYHLITGGSGAGLNTPSTIKTYSATIVYTINTFAEVDIDGSKLKLKGIDANGVKFDEFDLDNRHGFKIDGLLDSNGYGRATNGLILHAAIRSNYLYVATQDAGEGNDHFIYLNNVLSTNRPANWAKAGTVMQWSAFLSDENDNGFKGWFGNNEQMLTNPAVYRSMTSGLNNNGSFGNGVLEGTINLPAHFGSWPQQIYIAAAPFTTTNGGALVSIAQVPAGNGDGNITSNEFLALNTRDIALDLPVANAGVVQTNEAGMTVTLNGSASTAPSGLPLSYNWTQLSGTAVNLVNSTTALPNFTLASNVNETLTFQLTVNDSRFDSNATATVTLTSMLDTDGDGLSDTEETTGLDNVLTAANPNGQTTNPNLADTDGDGASDGDEALAGTNPNSAASVFHITRTAADGGGFNVEWTAVAGKNYVLDYRDDLSSAWSPLTNVMANTTLTNVMDGTPQPKRFYRVRLAP